MISDELWEKIAPVLPEREKKPHPLGCHCPRIPDRVVLNGIFFLLRSGGQWKSLDATGICKSSTAHSRFREWLEAGFFARLWEASLLEYDGLKGLDFEWMALDGALTKAPLTKAPLGGKKSGPNPCDRGKGGVKRSTLTEANGIVVGLVTQGANRHDMKLVRETLESVPPMVAAKRDEFLFSDSYLPFDWELAVPQCGLCSDAGYDFDEVREVMAEFGYTAHIQSRGEEKRAKGQEEKARRWVVERTHSWLNRWDKKADSYLAFLHFACAILTWNKALFG